MLEIEIKAKVNNTEKLIQKLTKLGASFKNKINQKDTIYFPIGKELKDVKHDTPVQRIRIQDGKAILTLKLRKDNNNHLDKIEYETEVRDPEIMNKMLEIMGFYQFIQVNKERLKCNLENYEICVDKVENLGDFIELEYQTDDDKEDTNEIRRKMWEFLYSLDADISECEQLGYDILLHKKLNAK